MESPNVGPEVPGGPMVRKLVRRENMRFASSEALPDIWLMSWLDDLHIGYWQVSEIIHGGSLQHGPKVAGSSRSSTWLCFVVVAVPKPTKEAFRRPLRSSTPGSRQSHSPVVSLVRPISVHRFGNSETLCRTIQQIERWKRILELASNSDFHRRYAIIRDYSSKSDSDMETFLAWFGDRTSESGLRMVGSCNSPDKRQAWWTQ